MLPINLDDEIEYMDEHARTKMLHDSPQFRAVLFCMEKGQGVGRHTSTSEVMMQVYRGSGTVIVGDKEYQMKEGEMIMSRPNEVHGFRSEGERFVILALIVPQPG
ncbi:MAG: cupin domain-containing protein [Nitrospirae bacterium]|nr:cupin domain-containing protein [Nitrospirota bacterium]